MHHHRLFEPFRFSSVTALATKRRKAPRTALPDDGTADEPDAPRPPSGWRPLPAPSSLCSCRIVLPPHSLRCKPSTGWASGQRRCLQDWPCNYTPYGKYGGEHSRWGVWREPPPPQQFELVGNEYLNISTREIYVEHPHFVLSFYGSVSLDIQTMKNQLN